VDPPRIPYLTPETVKFTKDNPPREGQGPSLEINFCPYCGQDLGREESIKIITTKLGYKDGIDVIEDQELSTAFQCNVCQKTLQE